MVLKIYSFLLLKLSLAEYPVNRGFCVAADEPTPDLKCVIGFLSISNGETWHVNCSQAHNYEVEVSKSIRADLGWPVHRRILRIRMQEDGCPLPEQVDSRVCSITPFAGTVTFNCLPEVSWI